MAGNECFIHWTRNDGVNNANRIGGRERRKMGPKETRTDRREKETKNLGEGGSANSTKFKSKKPKLSAIGSSARLNFQVRESRAKKLDRTHIRLEQRKSQKVFLITDRKSVV